MKRPLAVVGFTMLSVLIFLCLFEKTISVAFFCCVFSILFFLALIFKKIRQTAFLPVIFGSAAAACLLLLIFNGLFFQPVQSFCGERIEITATVEEYPHESASKERLYFLSSLDFANGKPAKGKVRLSFPAQEWKRNTPLMPQETRSLEPGDEVTFVGNLYSIASDDLSLRNYFKSNGFSLAAYPLGEVTVKKHIVKNSKTILLKERQKAANQILLSFDGDISGVVVSILMGNKSYLDDETYSAFSKSGTAHTMAVSGLHLSIWIMFILEILRRRGAVSKLTVIFMMFFVLLIMFFASFSGSVRRAGLMMLLYLCSELFSGKADSLNSLGFSAVVVLGLNPYSAVNPSFLLSFLAAFSIIVFAVPFSDVVIKRLKKFRKFERIEKLLNAVIVSIFVSFFAEMATLPLQIRYFGGFSTVGILTNLLFLPAFSPAVLCSGMYVMFYFVPLFSRLLLWAAQLSARYCVFIAGLMSSFKYSYISVNEKSAAAAAVIVFALLSALYLLLRSEKKKERQISVRM